MSTTRTIRWVLAHEPYDIFLRAAEKFSNQVAEKTNNAIQIEVLGLNEYVEKYNTLEESLKHNVTDAFNLYNELRVLKQMRQLLLIYH